MLLFSVIALILGIVCWVGAWLFKQKLWCYGLFVFGSVTVISSLFIMPLGIVLLISGAVLILLGLINYEGLTRTRFKTGHRMQLVLTGIAVIVFLATGVTLGWDYYQTKTTSTSVPAVTESSNTGTTVYKTSALKLNAARSFTHKNDWIIKGQTSAPDGAKILALVRNEPRNTVLKINVATTKDYQWVKVKGGQFTAHLNALEIFDPYAKKKAHETQEIYLVALTNYQNQATAALSPKIVAQIQETNPFQLTLSRQQAQYLNRLADPENDAVDDFIPDTTQSSSSTSPAKASATSSSASTTASSETTSSSASSKTSDTTKAQTTTKASAEDRAALNTAKSYATKMAMSKQGVYDQLVASAGEGFTPAAAQYAINHLTGIDWNENALKTAQDYQKMDMSRNAIMDQLTAQAGEKFTQAQAQYALDHLSK